MDEHVGGLHRSHGDERRDSSTGFQKRQDLFCKSVQGTASSGRTTSVAPARQVAEGDAAEILSEVWSPGCAAAIWRRALSEPTQTWLDTMDPEQLPALRTTMGADCVDRAVNQHFDELGVRASSFREFLVGDIAMLAGVFAQVMKTPSVRVRLDVISTNACRKFHLDNVSARLLCTYRGRGTQYGIAQKQSDPDPIHELDTASVGLFRGQRWPAAEPTGIVHRSPPIDGQGETRLLLVIDEDLPSEEL